jgi:hypothetical protein
LRRIDEYGNVIEVPIYSSFSNDPLAIASPHGFMTDGIRIWVVSSNFGDGHGTAFAIGPEIEDVPAYMAVYHTRIGAAGVHEAAPATPLSTVADSLQCKTIITLVDATYYREFQEFCAAIWASLVIYGARESSPETLRILAESGDTSGSDNPSISGTGLRIGTTSEQWCQVKIGYGNEEDTTIISIRALNPATLRGADRWMCDGTESLGTSCSANGTWNLFTPEIRGELEEVIVVNTDTTPEGTTGNGLSIDLGDPLSVFSTFGDIKSIVMIVIIIIVGLVVVGIIIAVLRCFILRRSRSRGPAFGP